MSLIGNWEADMNKSLIFSLLTFTSTACATTPSARARTVVESELSEVKFCHYKGEVSGTSMMWGLAHSTGVHNARNEALDQAASLGANHIVWDSTDGGYIPSVSGSAYECPLE